MTDKEAFINLVDSLIEPLTMTEDTEIQQAMNYYNKLKNGISTVTVKITGNGAKVLSWMQKNWEKCNNTFSAKTIGEGIFASSRSVSGTMRKLVTEGYVEKIGANPCCYAITDAGKEQKFDKN